MPPGPNGKRRIKRFVAADRDVAIQRLELFKSSLKQPKECLVRGNAAARETELCSSADGYWVGGVELPAGSDGTRRFKRIVRKDRNDALLALRQLKADVAAGKIVNALDHGRQVDGALAHRDPATTQQNTARTRIFPAVTESLSLM